MKLKTNLFFQMLACFVQWANLTASTQHHAAWIALAVGVAQAVVAWRAHYSNPDGTPASLPYRGGIPS